MKCLIILLLLGASIPITVSAQESGVKPFSIEGTIKGMDSGHVYLNYLLKNGSGTIDSTKMTNGHFVLNGYIPEPEWAYFTTFGFPGPRNNNNIVQIFIGPGKMHLTAVRDQFKDIKLSGSRSELQWKQFLSAKAKIIPYINNAYDSLDQATRLAKEVTGKDSIAIRQVWERKIDSLNRVVYDVNRSSFLVDSVFIAQHPDSYVSVYLLSRASIYWLSFPSLLYFYNRFPDSIKNSNPGEKIRATIEREKHTMIGSIAPDFVIMDSKGDTISLDKYKGKKYVLLDFGASWCEPCRQLIPYLEKDYEKYDTSFTIIGISTQDEYDDWLKALRQDSTPWPQVLENSHHLPIAPHTTIAEAYYIGSIPALVLVDKESRIIGKFGNFYSSGPYYMLDLNNQLSKIFHR